MKPRQILIFSFSFLLVSLFPKIVYGDESSQSIGGGNDCPVQIINSQGVTIHCVSSDKIDSSNPLPPQLAFEELKQKCQNGDVPETILIPTKKEYYETELITVKFANVCPGKTSLVIKPANSPTTGMNTGYRKRRTIVREYAGELPLDKGSFGEGSYEIHAYFGPEPTDVRIQHITGVSKTFNIVPRI